MNSGDVVSHTQVFSMRGYDKNPAILSDNIFGTRILGLSQERRLALQANDVECSHNVFFEHRDEAHRDPQLRNRFRLLDQMLGASRADLLRSSVSFSILSQFVVGTLVLY